MDGKVVILGLALALVGIALQAWPPAPKIGYPLAILSYGGAIALFAWAFTATSVFVILAVLDGIGILGALAWPLVKPRIRKPQGIPGWDTTVRGITQSSTDKRLYTIFLELYTPNDQPSDGRVTCELWYGDTKYAPKRHLEPQWDITPTVPGQRPHYRIIVPIGFEEMGDALRDGTYEIRWLEQHGLVWREVTRHHFTLRNGELATSKRLTRP